MGYSLVAPDSLLMWREAVEYCGCHAIRPPGAETDNDLVRARGRDIAELFGYQPDDLSAAAQQVYAARQCPFSGRDCTKTNHDGSVVYGVCSVTEGSRSQGSDIVICPTRLYADGYTVLKDIAVAVWGAGVSLVVSGTLAQLKTRALAVADPVVAFGHGSGREIGLQSNGGMSLDWVLQRYSNKNQRLTPVSFVGVEVQSIDTTGNYRDNWEAYRRQRTGTRPREVAPSGHGLNFANVHKRLIPQLIRKGNIYSEAARCEGFVFVVPVEVYRRFDEVLSSPAETGGFGRGSISVLPCALGPQRQPGTIRPLTRGAFRHFSLDAIKRAFSHDTHGDAPRQLDEILKTIL